MVLSLDSPSGINSNPFTTSFFSSFPIICHFAQIWKRRFFSSMIFFSSGKDYICFIVTKQRMFIVLFMKKSCFYFHFCSLWEIYSNNLMLLYQSLFLEQRKKIIESGKNLMSFSILFVRFFNFFRTFSKKKITS